MSAHLTPAAYLAAIATVTVLIEALTITFRFAFNLRSNTHTRFVARVTRGRRVHHAYIGVAMLLASLLVPFAHPLHAVLVIAGTGTALSDLIHHYLVLWPLTGSPEFDLRYPAIEEEFVSAD